jgi:predicted nucleic acid-binding protein
MTYLLDTSVISELRRRDPDPHVLAWYARVTSADVFVSVLTIGEIRLGIERLRKKDGAQAELLERWLHGLHHTYGDHIVKVDAAIAEEWGRLNTHDPLPIIDGLLAASAKVRGWTLVTRNTADVARTGVMLVNPFDPAAS